MPDCSLGLNILFCVLGQISSSNIIFPDALITLCNHCCLWLSTGALYMFLSITKPPPVPPVTQYTSAGIGGMEPVTNLQMAGGCLISSPCRLCNLRESEGKGEGKDREEVKCHLKLTRVPWSKCNLTETIHLPFLCCKQSYLLSLSSWGFLHYTQTEACHYMIYFQVCLLECCL